MHHCFGCLFPALLPGDSPAAGKPEEPLRGGVPGGAGPLPIVVALPEGTVREDPEPEDEVPNTKLEWREVKEAQGMLKSPWARVRRAAC